MLNSSLSYVIIRSFPESIFLILSGYILFNLNIKLKNIIRNSLFYLVILTCIRMLPISFGIHTVLSMFVIGMIFYKFENQQIISTIINVSKIYICLAISEGIYMVIADKILKIPTQILTNNTSINSAILSLPSLLIFILLIIGINLITKKISENI
ncbi:hypothetical protein LEQ06_01745 [Paraclostridium sp. AKS46]|uniref:Uncharacterized protein n=1 Tax=Paraclostridium bifermentans TaxID=1490 RepID=A0A5P3XI05_PARBF|nr:hypothetical protein [Paraclostridium bifermentans]MCU9807020.1 hypothetical protein [Paraclostridium sp. AKS46]QEZ69912.1 hypothetical protein D4A35_13840 [Paraclostridium bifermentans]